tara:strand:- start:8411 stop:13081 length:4671 start_codon:yes stop_codon:yes gene_type:complete
MTQLIEPDEVDGDIYDEIANLENWQGMLSDLIANNDISQEEFDSEMLKTRYYLDIKTKTYVLDDDDAEIIEKLRKYKRSLTENYKFGIISEEEFNKEYISILRKEYDILKLSENDQDDKRTSENIDLDLPLSEKLQKLHEAEVKHYKTVAKKNGILFPKLPKGVNKEQVNEYYDLKLSGNLETVIPEIEEYIKMYSATKQLIDFHTTSFEVSKIFYDTDTNAPNYEFKMVAPISNKLDSLRFLEKRVNLLLPEEQAYSDRLNILKNRLRQMPRTDLLKCAGIRTVKFMSYIERLKENKQNVIKFKDHPVNYEILKQIIEEDNLKYYKIPSDQLFKEYIYARPDILQSFVEETETNLTDYLEKGNTGYLAIKPGSNLKDLGEGLESFVTVLPFEDELYTELKNKEGYKTEIDKVWELRMSLPGSTAKNLIKRYLSFEDYLTDLKDILVNNSKMLSGTSKDVINSKIRKINYYLMYNEDPEMYLPTGHTSVSDLFKNRSDVYKMRQEGLYKLLEFITTYYPGADTLVEKIESDIFDYSSSNYKFNISKFMFLINNFQEKLDELITGSVSIIQLLAYETPKTLPEEDIDIRSDKQENINKLLNWNPDTSFYDIYKTELENMNHQFYKFKKAHPELSNLEISYIMSQYSESIQWKTSLQNYNKLKVPDGYIELNFRLRYLLKQRNKLPSRRIFTLASVSDRINKQKKFLATFIKCKFPEPNKYSVLTENIIYGLSKTPEYYEYYNSLVNSEYKKLCEYFTRVNLNCTLDDSGTVKCILAFEPNILTPVITEFLVTQGEFSTVDIQRLKIFTENINSNNILSYIRNLRGAEIDAYNRSIMEQVNEESTSLNEIYLKAARILKTAKFKKQLEKLATISYSTYKPPIVSVEKPVKIRHGREYTPDYIKVGDYYIYGGFYPMFNSYSEDSVVLSENYTRYDLEQLAIIFNLELLEDSFELYKSIMEFMRDYNKKETVIEKINFNPIEYNTYYEYLKLPTKTIMYTIRPRLGVQEPGEVYTVIKDESRKYGVPFDFNKDTVPIYSEDLKERVDDGFIIIEGPCIFQKTSGDNNITSDSYINIEYRDSRGKSKIFREGVAIKKIKKKTIDSINTCSRFTTKTSCDDPNSYSLDVKGLKFKCKWLNEKCNGIIVESDELKSFDINDVKFKDFSKNKLWQTAIDKSIKYIEELTKLKELTQEEIKTLSKEQKTRLFNYYNILNKPKKALQSIPEEKTEIKSYSLIDQFEDLLKPKNNVFKIRKTITEGYTDFTVYNLTSTSLKLPMKTIMIGSEYTVNGDVVIPKEYHSDDASYTCEIKETGETIILEREEFRRKTNEIITKAVPLFCLVKNEDLPFLSNLPGYYWYDKKITYIPIEDEVVRKEEIIKMTNVPANFINPSSLLNGKPLINRADIFEAISRTAFSTLSSDNSFIYYITDKVNAEKNAIEFAVKNKIDINDLFSKIIGTITLPDVIEEYETKNPKKIISKTEITDIILAAIENKDKNKLAEYFIRAKKSKIDPDILKEAKTLLKELPDVQEVPKEETVPEPVKQEPVPIKNIYTAARRRR